MQSLLADLRFALRAGLRQKGATLLALFTLALAVAANTAVFTLLDALFLRPLPVADADRVVYLDERAPRWNLEYVGINFPDFYQWSRSTRSFEAMGLYDSRSVNLFDGATAERVPGAEVTADFPRAIGVEPILGRGFTAQEDRPGGPHVVMIGYAFWRSHFAGDSGVLGRTLTIDSRPYTVVGVLPATVAGFPEGAQLWLPLAGDPAQVGEDYSYAGVARLKPGVTLAQARADLLRAQEPVWADHDPTHIVSPVAMPLRDKLIANYRSIGRAIGLAVVLVLLIACANVAGTMLARGTFRSRELAVRMALGAGAVRVGRQLLTEALALALVAGVLGTLGGALVLSLVMRSAVDQFPPWIHVTFGWHTVVLSAALVTATVVLFGLLPALQSRRLAPAAQLTGGGTRTTGGRSDHRLLDLLVIAENALAVVLLVVGGLLLRTYGNLQRVEPGFRVDSVVSFRLVLPAATYPNGLAQGAFFERLLTGIRALPSVRAVGAITCPPLGCHRGMFFEAEGGTPPGPDGSDPVVLARSATPGYFAAMGIELVRGRFFDQTDGGPGRAQPVVVNQSFARRMWPGLADPTGRRIRSRGDTASADWLTVVGVARDVRHYGLDEAPRPGIYLSTRSVDSTGGLASMALIIRTGGDPSGVLPGARALVRRLDPGLPLFQVHTMRQALDDSFAFRRLFTVALGVFGAVALVLALGGVYAVLSYLVGRRRREIGIRMALGAEAGRVLRMVLRQGGRLVLIGLVIGLPVSLAAARLLGHELVGVGPFDPATYALAA
ncbi:MAG TPA: ABC transporter permease, partial [Gemmatimonadales bacterium]|nr:ABC transporter permease [Gemmatimonadales bacterium]